MHKHTADLSWTRAADEKFTDGRYSRAHTWQFDGGVTVPASSSAHVVPLPYSRPENVDPEEAFVGAISSCHLLTFLYVAGKAGYVVDAYRDHAAGVLQKNEQGHHWVSQVTLQPEVVFSGAKVPTEADVEHLHHRAHEQCFIANSVKTQIDVQGRWSHRP
jgi:organic hydroperoxide reductase OsmC/OhrA